jgi:hypothetical protein
MSWVENRIEQYKKGEKLNWREKWLLGYWYPVNAALFFLGQPPLIYGLWERNWLWIVIGALAVIVISPLHSFFTRWPEKRMEEVKRGGKPLNWWEKRGLEEAHPVFFALALPFSIVLFYGLWTHNWWLIGIGLATGFLGRLIPWREK